MWMPNWSVSDWTGVFGSIGEFAIAGVIYYELEEGRASAFLRNVQSEKFLEDRRELYKEQVKAALPSASLKTRAEEFCKKLKKDDKLRSKCDLQWSNIDRLQYALRRSPLHWNLPAKWFPQALVSLWVMTGPYVRYLQEIRLHDAHVDGEKAVGKSINALVRRKKKKGKIGPITIYGEPTDSPVVVPEEMILAMQNDLDAPFKQFGYGVWPKLRTNHAANSI